MLELSPRAWGVRTAHEWTEWGRGAIPTYVGLTCAGLLEEGLTGSYPHGRGAYFEDAFDRIGRVELSPRAWGVLPPSSENDIAMGAIPTYVGLTGARSRANIAPASHPHVRGAYTPDGRRRPSSPELSPRVWGLLLAKCGFFACGGVIPTCVGLTIEFAFAHSAYLSYPHVCGAYPCPPAVMLAGGVFLIRLFTVEFSSTAFLSTYHLPGRVSRSPQP